jgi:large subunit ribosomal protein L3
MSPSILGRKVGMTQVYLEDGTAVPVTVIQAGPCQVLQIRSLDRDGYEAIQLGFADKPRRLANRSERGHVAKIESKRSKKRTAGGVELAPKADVKKVDVTGISKGRGYSGVMKRHNFAGQRATHGVKKCHRHPGSTGASSYPARVVAGMKMAGQYGNAQITTRNLELVRIDSENNLLLIRGAVPGPNGGYITIRQTNKVG